MSKYKFVKDCKVFVNGINIVAVARFNIADGWVEALVESPSGYSNLDQEVDKFVVSRLYGHIEVEYT